MAEPTTPGGRFLRNAADPSARLRLFCFPFAGGGASSFYPWSARMPAGVAICPIHLAGREDRLAEAAPTQLPRLVDALAAELGGEFRRGPFAFFGHSLGGLVAFELARVLKRDLGLEPAHLFVSAARAPGSARASSPISGLDDGAFLAALGRRYDGLPAAVLRDRELMALFLPALRADFAMFDAYRHEAGDRLEAPISAFGGLEDREVGPGDIEGWRDQTRGAFRLRLLPGGHFFLKTAAEALLRAVAEDLAVVGHGAGG